MLHIKPMIDALNVHADHYVPLGDYSVTTILNPPRYVHLQRRYGKDKNLNYPAMLPSFIGTGVHAYVEDCLRKAGGYALERRLFYNVLGRTISGQFDIFDGAAIWDIKTAKTWKLIFDPEATEWTQQQNIYAHMLRAEGTPVDQLNIIAIYLDWIYDKNVRDQSYPDAPIQQYVLDLWEPEYTQRFLEERVGLMIKYEDTPDDDLPMCDEVFEDPTVFACYKNVAAKRSSKNCQSLEEAVAYMKQTKGFGSGSYVEVRPQIRKRCERYCEVNHYCNKYKKYMQAKASETGLNWTVPYDQV